MPPRKREAQNEPKTLLELHHAIKCPSKAFTKLLKLCDQIDGKSDALSLLAEGDKLPEFAQKVYDSIARFQAQISQIPLMSIVLLWASEIDAHATFRDRCIECITDLIEQHILPRSNEQAHKLLMLCEFQSFDHAEIFDAIRSYKNWPVDKQEEYTSTYHEFAHWLSEVTFGLIIRPVDADRIVTLHRRLPFNVYIKVLKELSDRERILAKIFYLGGSRSLEEVLSLKIEDIDFKKSVLKLSGEAISYPKHVFEDLKTYIKQRKKGYVFIGKQGDRIDHTVPYRALKTVTSKLDLDPSFTFKDFVKNM